MGIFDVTCDISSNAISFVLKDDDTDSENFNLMAFYIRWPENEQLKGCIIDRYIIKKKNTEECEKCPFHLI